MCGSSPSQHTSSNHQFQKEQPKTYLQKLNFLNPIKILTFFTIKRFCMVISWSPCICLCVFSPPLSWEMGITQQAAATSTWQLYCFIWKSKNPRTAKNSLVQEKNFQKCHHFLFQVYYIEIIIKNTLFWHKNRQVDLWEPNTRTRSKFTQLWTLDVWQRRQNYTMKKRHHLQQMVLV